MTKDAEVVGEAGVKGRLVRMATRALSLAAAVVIGGFIIFWPYIIAWFTIDGPTPDERRNYFEKVRHRGGVQARLARSGMRSLKGDEIASVGDSRCDRELYCGRSGRSGCLDVQARFYCTYQLVTRDGEPGTGIVYVHIHDLYDPHSHREENRRLFYIASEMSLDQASDRLCRLGVCR